MPSERIRPLAICFFHRNGRIGTLENIFTYQGTSGHIRAHQGTSGHEIVQVYDGKFLDQALYARASVQGVESEGQPLEAAWREFDYFSAEKPLYPNGLLALLRSKAALLAADAKPRMSNGAPRMARYSQVRVLPPGVCRAESNEKGKGGVARRGLKEA